ncbi:hypothetical protein AVEN_18755-1 [Araneus ventricosus]|uniref:Uncharacterized protein n=1 Tax=Araneus ventricosus TaxID=182803 RepID=A0A4Y2G533_ARAVE|nr:hypothetical protein AVEN_18755-1 [Araneus ventricosus]
MIKNRDQDNPEEREKEDVSTDLVSHPDAACTLELALRYVEQQVAATPTDIMFMRRWRDIASSGRFNSKRQRNITDFVSTN